MRETEKIEKGTAEGFLALYNQHFGTDFETVEVSDAPDVRCADSHGNRLNIEVTATEDRPGDIQALLQRSQSRSPEALQAHLDRVARGEEPLEFSSLSDEVLDHLVERIQHKMKKDYGQDVALVVRDTSGVDWEWNEVAPAIAARIDSRHNPFQRGIWVLSRTKDRLFKIV